MGPIGIQARDVPHRKTECSGKPICRISSDSNVKDRMTKVMVQSKEKNELNHFSKKKRGQQKEVN